MVSMGTGDVTSTDFDRQGEHGVFSAGKSYTMGKRKTMRRFGVGWGDCGYEDGVGIEGNSRRTIQIWI